MSARACRDVRAVLSAYLDDDLDAVALGEIRAHLESCAACHRELDLLRLTVGALRRLPDLPPPAGILAGVRARLRPDPWYRRLLQRRRWLLGVPVSALATLALVVAISLFQARFPGIERQTAHAPQPPAAPAPRQAAGSSPAPLIREETTPQPAPAAAFRHVETDAAKKLETQEDFAAAPSRAPFEPVAGAREMRLVCLLPAGGDTVEDLRRLLRRAGVEEIESAALDPQAVREYFAPPRNRPALLPENAQGWTVTVTILRGSLPRLLEALAGRPGLRILERPAADPERGRATDQRILRITVFR